MDSDDLISNPAPLVAAGQVMAKRKAFGLVWMDQDLVVRARYGVLVDFVKIDALVTETLFPLVGLEEDLRSLQTDTDRVVYLPGIAPVLAEDDTRRLNLTFFWSEPDKRYLMLVAQTLTGSDIEQELSKQMRARLMAEAEVAETSRALSKANKELARVNRDLEDYAAIISHDLKAPLRGMRYIADDIETAMLSGDTSASLANLQKLKDQSLRMSHLMTALLDYASAGRKTEIMELVDTELMVQTVVNSLGYAPTIKIAIEGAWPTARTLRAPLDLVIRNLIDNAIKHHDKSTAHICVRAVYDADNLMISFQDDGPGIDPRHHAAILLPFRTLSQTADTASGMGLALVQRTVESYGGSIRVESDPTTTRGSRFVVHWPLNLEST